MASRGISIDDVEEALKKGSRELQGSVKVLYHYQYFTVVTRKIGNDLLVITVKPRW